MNSYNLYTSCPVSGNHPLIHGHHDLFHFLLVPRLVSRSVNSHSGLIHPCLIPIQKAIPGLRHCFQLCMFNARHHDRVGNIRYFYRENPEVPAMAMQQIRRLLESDPIIPRAIQMDMELFRCSFRSMPRIFLSINSFSATPGSWACKESIIHILFVSVSLILDQADKLRFHLHRGSQERRQFHQ